MLWSACPSRPLRRALGVLIVLGVVAAGVASPGAAWAQDDARFRHGVDLYQRGDYRAALAEFEAVYATSPTPALVYNLGRTLEHLGRNAEAVTRYGEYLDAGSPGMTPGARNELVGHVRELRAGLVELTVQGQPGLYVTANAMPMGTIPAVMTLDPGTYSIQAGHARQDVTLAPGEHRTIYLEEPAPAGGGNGNGSGNGGGNGNGSSGSGSGNGSGSGSGSGDGSGSGNGSGSGVGGGGGGGLGTGAWVSLGMAGAAVVTTVITGIVALGKQSTADDLARELEDETDPARRERLARDGLDANSAGRTYATVADISLVAAAIAGGVFTVLVVSATPDARTPVTPAPPASVSLLPGGGALVTARGTW